MSIVRYAEPGKANEPSPSVWKDCPRGRLVSEGTGYYFHEGFLGGATSAAFLASMTVGSGSMSFTGDTATVFAHKAAELGGWMDIETDGDDNDGWSIHTEPMAKIVLNSGQKVWLETHMEIGDADGDQGFFFGLAAEAAQSQDIIADGCAALIGESLVGFRLLTGENAIDFVYKLDAGAEVIVASDVTNASALDAGAALADSTPFKLGMRFDGKETLQVFVNGTKIAEASLASATFPDSVDMVTIMALKTGAIAAESAAVDWVRAGYQSHP